jgi:hypothetical protein
MNPSSDRSRAKDFTRPLSATTLLLALKLYVLVSRQKAGEVPGDA